MACRPFGTNPLHEPMQDWEQLPLILESNASTFRYKTKVCKIATVWLLANLIRSLPKYQIQTTPCHFQVRLYCIVTDDLTHDRPMLYKHLGDPDIFTKSIPHKLYYIYKYCCASFVMYVCVCMWSDYQQHIYKCVCMWNVHTKHFVALNMLCDIASKLQCDNSCSVWNYALFRHVISIGNKASHDS